MFCLINIFFNSFFIILFVIRSFKLKSLIENSTHTIIHMKYFLDSIQKNKLLNPFPYILSISHDLILKNSKDLQFDAIFER